MLRNSHVRFGGGRLETQVMLRAGRLSYMVAFCESKEDAEEVVQILKDWLKERGLEARMKWNHGGSGRKLA